MNTRMEAIRKQITLGEPICVKLKQIFFATKSWPECKQDLPKLFSKLKTVARKYYKNEVEMLESLNKYTEQDIRDALNV